MKLPILTFFFSFFSYLRRHQGICSLGWSFTSFSGFIHSDGFEESVYIVVRQRVSLCVCVCVCRDALWLFSITSIGQAVNCSSPPPFLSEYPWERVTRTQSCSWNILVWAILFVRGVWLEYCSGSSQVAAELLNPVVGVKGKHLKHSNLIHLDHFNLMMGQKHKTRMWDIYSAWPFFVYFCPDYMEMNIYYAGNHILD